MPSRSQWLAALADRLERLRVTLDTLADRVRDAVAQAVSEAVAGAVRESFGLLTIRRPAQPFPSYRPPWPTQRTSSAWDDRDEWDREERDEWAEDHHQDTYRREPTPVERPQARTQASNSARWARAASVGCRAAAWWLYREAGRVSAVAVLAVAAAATTATYLAGAGLASSALSLILLLDLMRSGTGLIARAGLP